MGNLLKIPLGSVKEAEGNQIHHLTPPSKKKRRKRKRRTKRPRKTMSNLKPMDMQQKRRKKKRKRKRKIRKRSKINLIFQLLNTSKMNLSELNKIQTACQVQLYTIHVAAYIIKCL